MTATTKISLTFLISILSTLGVSAEEKSIEDELASSKDSDAVLIDGWNMNFFKQNTLEYQHNRVAVLFLVPPLMAVFYSIDSPYPIQTTIFLTLTMYAMDMANARELLSVFLWVSSAILTLITGWFLLLGTPDDEDGGLTTLTVILRTAGNCFLFLCMVGSSLQISIVWLD